MFAAGGTRMLRLHFAPDLRPRPPRFERAPRARKDLPKGHPRHRESGQTQRERLAWNLSFRRASPGSALAWAVDSSSPAADDLAGALAKLEKAEERQQLLAGEQELVSVDLREALVRQSRQLLAKKAYSQALA